MLAKVVAICGPDKSGKATQSKMLAHTLKRYGDRAVRVEVPFNDRVTHRVLYWMLRNGTAKSHPNLFQIIQFFNKLFFQWTVLLWLRLTCSWVVLDRWSLSAIVYGDATGVNKTLNTFLYHLLMKPDLTLILTGSSYDRKSVDDSYESDSDLQKNVRMGYMTWAARHLHKGRFDIIGSYGTRDEVHERVYKRVLRLEDNDKI